MKAINHDQELLEVIQDRYIVFKEKIAAQKP